MNVIYYKKNEFLIHFKNITHQMNNISNGIFSVSFKKNEVKDFKYITSTSNFSKKYAYHVFFDNLYIFDYSVNKSKLGIFG